MSGDTVSLILDVIIILLLAGTAFLAARLSVHLKNFREGRKSMDKLLADLTAQVDRAQGAIDGMRENARSSGRDLQQVINDAKALSDELQIIIGAADGRAERLAKNIERVQKNVTMFTPFSGSGDEKPQKREEKNISGFSIRDPEFDLADESGEEDDFILSEPGTGAEEFGSRAERELFEAMQGRKKAGAGRS